MANLAAANVMHRKTRTAVSVLAVAVQVAMVMLLVGLANGTLGDIAERLQNVGADVLFQPPDASFLLGATSAVMPMKYVDIMKQVDGVTEVTPVLNWHVSKIKGESRAVNLWAIDYPSFARISGGFDIVEGRALEQPYDLVMDTVLAGATGIRAGDKLPMMNRDFTVVGHRARGGGGPPLRAPARRAGGHRHARPRLLLPGQGPLRAGGGQAGRRPCRQRFPGHKITPVAQVSKIMQDNATGLKQFKEALTGMAVVISFLVVLLAMYTTIIERTREIGILRAIGASQTKVVQLVINESASSAWPASWSGIALAVAGRWLLPHVFPTLTVQLTREWALIASALGLAGGLLGSFYPAVKAARMDPVQALNFE